MIWNWEAIAGFVTAGFLLVAAYFAWRQIRTAKLNRNAQLVVEMHEYLRSVMTVETLHLIYRTKPEDMRLLSSTDIYKIERLADRLGMIGHLVNQGAIDKYMAVEALAGPPSLRCWHQLKQFIEERRQQRGGRYGLGIRYYAKYTVKYQIENSPRNHWILFYMETPGEEDTINLVKRELEEPDLLSRWELRKAKAKRKVRSSYKKQLR